MKISIWNSEHVVLSRTSPTVQLKGRISPAGASPDDGWRYMGKYSPKNSPKGAWIGSLKPKRQNLYIAISPELLIQRTSDLRSEFRPWGRNSDHERHFVGGPPFPQSKHNMADNRHLENWYDVIFQRRMFRFGRNSTAGCRITRGLWQNGQYGNRK